MQKIMGKEYYSEKEVCGLLGFSAGWMMKRRERNEAPPYIRFNKNGKILFEKEKLERWVKEVLKAQE